MPTTLHPREELLYRAFLSLIRISALLRKAGDGFFRNRDLTQCQFNILMVLKYEIPQGCSQTELCQRLLVKPADMSGLVRRMLRNNLVEREDDPKDQRAWRVRLTPPGKEPSKYDRTRLLPDDPENHGRPPGDASSTDLHPHGADPRKDPCPCRMMRPRPPSWTASASSR